MRQLTLWREELPREKLPTNLLTNHHPIHRWFNFIAGYSPEFVSQCIQEAQLQPDETLIDPFSGLSTSLVQSNFEGIRSVGFEVHPFFYDISLAKLFPPTDRLKIDQIETMAESIVPYSGNLMDIWREPAVTFLSKLISDKELRLLASALSIENQIDITDRPMYRLILSRVLELTAHSQTDGIYKAPTTQKGSVSYRSALGKVCNEIRTDVELIGGYINRRATLHLMSSEYMLPLANESCSLCVTSPPYLNNFDYAEMSRMEFYYWRYASSWGEITERVRRKLIVNTTTAPTDLKRNQIRFSDTLSQDFRSSLQPLIDALKQQMQIKDGKKDYYLLVYPYFSQMQAVFNELRRVLKPASSFHLVVADAALYGVHIQTEQLLARLMQEIGFQIVDIVRLRTRGTRWVLDKRQGATQPLGEFHIHARRT